MDAHTAVVVVAALISVTGVACVSLALNRRCAPSVNGDNNVVAVATTGQATANSRTPGEYNALESALAMLALQTRALEDMALIVEAARSGRYNGDALTAVEALANEAASYRALATFILAQYRRGNLRDDTSERELLKEFRRAMSQQS